MAVNHFIFIDVKQKIQFGDLQSFAISIYKKNQSTKAWVI